MRILVADDHAAVRKGVCAILSSRIDIEVCGEAENGKEAIQKAIELRPDLIILDVTMPVVNGFDAARELVKILPEIPILMLTMHQSKQLLEEAKRIGVRGYLSKNQASDTLLHAVNTILSKGSFYPESE